MNKACMAGALWCAVAGLAQAQSNITIYGIADAALVYHARIAAGPAPDSLVTVNSGGRQASRIGIRGKEPLGGGLFAEFFLENGFAVDSGAVLQGGALFGRRSVVGLSGPRFGVLHIGRRKDFTDEVARDYSSISAYSGFITPVHASNLDRIGGNRANNMIYYSTPTVAGLRANVSYGFGESPGAISTGQSLGLGANYAAGRMGIGLGYWQSRLGTAASPTSDQGASAAGCSITLAANAGKRGEICIQSWIVGARYKVGELLLRGSYSQVRQPLINAAGGAAPDFGALFTATPGRDAFTAGGVNNRKAIILDLGADYRLAPDILLTTSAIGSRYDFVGATERGTLGALLAGVQYFMSRRTTLYTSGGVQSGAHMYNPGMGAGAPGADDRASFLALGVRHVF